MSIKILLVLFAVLCVFHGTAGELQCGSLSCGDGDSCCNDINTGYRCYDPSIYECKPLGLSQEGSLLCQQWEQACGNVCFNPYTHECNPGNVLCGFSTAPYEVSRCGDACYDPRLYECCNSQLYEVGHSSCTNQPYLNSEHLPLFCTGFNQTPCAEGQTCCGDYCINPEEKICITPGEIILNHGQWWCGYRAYETAEQECCDGIVFPLGTSACSQETEYCCSFSCDEGGSSWSEDVTVSSSEDCNADYISQFYETNYNVYGICGGGELSTSITADEKCPQEVRQLGGRNVTTYYPSNGVGYEEVPSNYTGEVCCWCASWHTSSNTVVPNIQSCSAAYIVQTLHYNIDQCIVWGRAEYESDGAPIPCGFPLWLQR